MAKHHPRQRTAFDPNSFDSVLDDIDDLLAEPVSPLTPINPLDQVKDLVGVQDLRRFDPTDAIPQDLVGRVAEVGRPVVDLAARTREFMEYPERLAKQTLKPLQNYFSKPFEALECARRAIRREVMFALPPDKRRKGAGARRRRDEYSELKC